MENSNLYKKHESGLAEEKIDQQYEKFRLMYRKKQWISFLVSLFFPTLLVVYPFLIVSSENSMLLYSLMSNVILKSNVILLVGLPLMLTLIFQLLVRWRYGFTLGKNLVSFALVYVVALFILIVPNLMLGMIWLFVPAQYYWESLLRMLSIYFTSGLIVIYAVVYAVMGIISAFIWRDFSRNYLTEKK